MVFNPSRAGIKWCVLTVERPWVGLTTLTTALGLEDSWGGVLNG